MSTKSPHIPVLLNEVINSFRDVKGGFFVDCTLGYGGHSREILEHYPQLKHIGIDRDDEALSFSKQHLMPFSDKSTLYKGTFANVFPTLQEKPIVAVLADFGVSSLQLDKLERGFSFGSETLDMRMDNSAKLSAYEVVNNYSLSELEYIFKNYGEINRSKELASLIIQERAAQPISSAKVLSEIALKVLPKGGKIHPATLVFQAIRIEVNNELGEIEGLLDALEANHTEGEIVSLITFHSLEDRLVKNRFTKWSKECICDDMAMRCTCGKNHALGHMLNKKPITASLEELKYNPRSRSAKLRTFCFSKSK
ncbi:MAG: 16S rRNA (cytosine(1402)-N(4))-methyltransferase RsmH [Sulfurovaceae bacterium]|nr:16S rRNA (cytosine(1402)-N(4))-methyltransferase RsmH [Sulfurovaceae bacterium]